jgi:nitroreductase
MNPTIETIMNRKSVRNFTGGSIDKEILRTIVKAGMAAPSAVNMQPWGFVVVTARQTLDALAEALPYAKMCAGAQAAIIVCGDPKLAPVDTNFDYWVQDCSAATQNILLAVESLGLGAVWTAAYPRAERAASVRQICGIPDGIMPLNVIPIGIPSGKDLVKDKFKAERIHWEKW